MIDTNMYVQLHDLDRPRHPAAVARRTDRHRGLQRSAREIALAVRRQRRHSEPV
jgi:hypothetical protein